MANYFFRPAAKAAWSDTSGTSRTSKNWSIVNNVCTVTYPTVRSWWLAGYDTGTMYKYDSSFNWQGVCKKINTIAVETFYTSAFHCRDITKGRDGLWYVVQNYAVSSSPTSYKGMWVFNSDWTFNTRYNAFSGSETNPSGAWQDPSDGSWYVVGLATPTIVNKYDESWNWVTSYTLTNMTDNFPTGIAKGNDGYFWIVNKGWAYKYNTSFVYQSRNSLQYTEAPTTFGTNSYGMCLGDDGNWYVTDINDDRINVYNSSWTHTGNYNSLGDSVMTGIMYSDEPDNPGLAIGDIVHITNGGVITEGDYTITSVSATGFSFAFTASDQSGTLDWQEYVWYDSLTSGAKHTSAPISTDVVTIARGWCTTASNIAAASLTTNIASRLDIYTYALTVSGTCAFNGIFGIGISATTGLTAAGISFYAGTQTTGAFLDMVATSKFNNSGNFYCAGFTIFTLQNKGDYTQTGNGTYNCNNNGNSWYKFRINQGCTLTLAASTTITNSSSGTTAIYGTLALSTYTAILGALTSFVMSDTADITGSGPMTITLTSACSVTWDKNTAITATSIITFAGLSGATTKPLANNFANSDIVLGGGSSGVATQRFTEGTLRCKNFSINQSANQNMTIDCATNNPIFNISGNISFKSDSSTYTLTYTKGEGSWTLSGSSGTQTIDYQGKSIGRLIIAATGAIKSIVSNFTTSSLSGTGGTIQSSVTGTQRVITATSTGVCSGMSFKDISMGSRSKVNAKSSCINLGNNLGIVFKDLITNNK